MRSERDCILSVRRWAAGFLPEPWDVRTDLEAGEPPDRPFALVEQAGDAETAGAPMHQELIVPVTLNLYLPPAESREAATDAAYTLREAVWRAAKWGPPSAKRVMTDRIPLFAYEPRLELHRLGVSGAAGGAFTVWVSVDGVPAQTAPLPPAATAVDVAAAISSALIAAGVPITSSDVTGVDRGTGLWEIEYSGPLVGAEIGVPMIDGSALVPATAFRPGTVSARVMLEGAASPWRGPSDFLRVTSFAQNTIRDSVDPTLVMVAVDLRLTFVRGAPIPFGTRILQRISATAGSTPEA